MVPPARLLGLYLRSRGVPYSLPGLLALLGLTAAAAERPLTRTLALLLGAALAAILLAGGFHSPQPELETASPLRWPAWRAAHIATGLTVCAVPLAAVMAIPDQAGALPAAMVRNVLGFTGLALLAALAAGARLSWTLPLGYALISWRLPHTTSPAVRIWHWPELPSHNLLAWAAALTLAAAGAALLTIQGPKPTS
jgi:hypothetical protein